jgi:hypothetical protein
MQPTQNTAVLDDRPVRRTGADPASTLRAAALYLVRHGWTQGAFYEQTTSVFTPAACMAGALGMVCYGRQVEAPANNVDDPGYGAFAAAAQHLDDWLFVWHGVLAYGFNDTPGRTIGDVIRALDDAADQWDRLSGGAA